MKYLKNSDKFALMFFGFMPWIMIWIFTYGFSPTPTQTSLQQSIIFVGPIWVMLYPFISICFVSVFIKAAVEWNT